MKIKSCGCIVNAVSIGAKKEDNKILYLLGGHNHLKVCEKCNQLEESGVDTLYDMWTDDNIADGSGTDGWTICSYYLRKVDN